MVTPGQIVILNGAPRAGKSSIVAVFQSMTGVPWMNLGVDVFSQYVTPPSHQPGMGLRPGHERPEIQELIPALFAAVYDSIAAHSRQGLNVICDIEHHDAYATPLHVLRDCAQRVRDLPALFVGVRCPLDVILQRRDATWPGWRDGLPMVETPFGSIPEPALRWQEAVHRPGIYDIEVDTSQQRPEECAAAILSRAGAAPAAFARLAGAA
ncbi:MAG: chloramphenicol phosphotransferase [Acidimicrobiaceae bacterium]|jgi:chloramphenicol 3-O phosphotransferase